MKIGSASRWAVPACALCVAGMLALTPTVAVARPSTAAPSPPDPPTAAVPQPVVLFGKGTKVRPHRGAPELPDLTALSWLVADAGTGEVLAAHDAHRKLPPASTLKTLFALTVLPALSGGSRHTVTAKELAGVGDGSSVVGVREGQTYQVSDLWRGVFLSSGNDAVHVLASLNGGWAATVARMQTEARALGAHDTHVVSPDGYDAPGQVSSAFDLAVFGRAGLRNPDFARYCSTVSAGFPGVDGSYGIENTNRLLTGEDGVARYPGLLGIKNGYTSEAGNTLVAAARRGERTFVVTVLNPQEDNGLTVYEEARALLDWGFAAAGRVDPVGSLDALRGKPRPTATPSPVPSPAAVAASVPDSGSGWSEPGVLAGVAGLSAGAVALALRVKFQRGARG